MGGDVQSGHRRTRVKGRIVKTGCRTCKIRRVKCDESRPACLRCASTGRICDGYGIWGGGGEQPTPRKHERTSLGLMVPLPAARDPDEMRSFEWFKSRTAPKIPGLFVLHFWDTLLFQACASEPAVLHAVLALSSVHRRHIAYVPKKEDLLDEEEQFMLQQYIKATRHLQPHLLDQDRFSVRVALITCVVFISLELLRGNFETARIHLQHGLKVLGGVPNPLCFNSDGIISVLVSVESIDGWIAEAFSRLLLQVLFFEQSYQQRCLVLQYSELKSATSLYCTYNEAWKRIEQLLNQILHLGRRARQSYFGYSGALLAHQRVVKGELASWLVICKASKDTWEDQRIGAFAWLMLQTYHSMAIIMAEVCLWPNDESIFDQHTELFISLIEQSINNWTLRLGASQAQTLQNKSRSVIDIGWIPPLFYTALRCRIHQVRVHAIRLLESTSHREGFWDSNIAAQVARKVMEAEEGDIYHGFDLVNDFPLSNSPRLGNLSLPILPQDRRVQEVHITLSDCRNVKLSYRQKQACGNWTVVSKEWQVIR